MVASREAINHTRLGFLKNIDCKTITRNDWRQKYPHGKMFNSKDTSENASNRATGTASAAGIKSAPFLKQGHDDRVDLSEEQEQGGDRRRKIIGRDTRLCRRTTCHQAGWCDQTKHHACPLLTNLDLDFFANGRLGFWTDDSQYPVFVMRLNFGDIHRFR